MDREVLKAVLGRPLNGLRFTTGRLAGYTAERAADYTFPTLIKKRLGRTDGVVVERLSAEDAARLRYFEDYEYALVVMDVTTAKTEIAAQVFMPTKLKSSGKLWNFEHWRKHDKPLSLAVTRRLMGEHYGVTPPEEVDAAWHSIEAEIKAQMASTPSKPRRPSRTPAATPAPLRRAKRAASPTRRPWGS